MDVKRTECGCVGHCIIGDRCLWRRHTQIGNFRVSSIGDFTPRKGGQRETLGAGDDSYFETMVFKTNDKPEKGSKGCGCMEIADWSEIDGCRYPNAGEAQEGHEAMVKKYKRIAESA